MLFHGTSAIEEIVQSTGPSGNEIGLGRVNVNLGVVLMIYLCQRQPNALICMHTDGHGFLPLLSSTASGRAHYGDGCAFPKPPIDSLGIRQEFLVIKSSPKHIHFFAWLDVHTETRFWRCHTTTCVHTLLSLTRRPPRPPWFHVSYSAPTSPWTASTATTAVTSASYQTGCTKCW